MHAGCRKCGCPEKRSRSDRAGTEGCRFTVSIRLLSAQLTFPQKIAILALMK